jgi:hypothetical protein
MRDTTKIYPNWDFWFENTPSGNPVCGKDVPTKYIHVDKERDGKKEWAVNKSLETKY